MDLWLHIVVWWWYFGANAYTSYVIATSGRYPVFSWLFASGLFAGGVDHLLEAYYPGLELHDAASAFIILSTVCGAPVYFWEFFSLLEPGLSTKVLSIAAFLSAGRLAVWMGPWQTTLDWNCKHVMLHAIMDGICILMARYKLKRKDATTKIELTA